MPSDSFDDSCNISSPTVFNNRPTIVESTKRKITALGRVVKFAHESRDREFSIREIFFYVSNKIFEEFFFFLFRNPRYEHSRDGKKTERWNGNICDVNRCFSWKIISEKDLEQEFVRILGGKKFKYPSLSARVEPWSSGEQASE